MKTFKSVLFAFICCVTFPVMSVVVSGCAAVASALPGVIAAIVDGASIIDAIASFVQKFFVAHPDPVAQKKVDSAIMKCRAALNVALRVAQGTDKLDQAKVDMAFDDFKAAYLELILLTRPYGVTPSSDGAAMTLKASPEGDKLEVPTPLAVARRSK